MAANSEADATTFQNLGYSVNICLTVNSRVTVVEAMRTRTLLRTGSGICFTNFLTSVGDPIVDKPS